MTLECSWIEIMLEIMFMMHRFWVFGQLGVGFDFWPCDVGFNF